MDTRKDIDDPDGDIYQWRDHVRDKTKAIEGWSGSTVFHVGQDDGLTLDFSHEELTLQVQFAKIGYYTIQAQFSTPQTEAGFLGSSKVSVKGELECLWSVEGNTIRRVSHVANGFSISGLGESVNIRLKNLSTPTVNEETFLFDINVGVSIAPGTRPTFGGAQPPIIAREFPLLTTNFFGPRQISVPNNVGSYCVYMLGVGDLANAFWGGQIAIDPDVGPSTFESRVFNKWVPLPPGANLILLTAGAGDIRIMPIFGIEG